ncbi:uncharacterized protein K460DRAFT_404393 [Cucurbitaria berberidis CBS 394.84]|uniref:Uncharacterized protein n=1 Tax=Cucurbitaria berberidis CBS 394.84 TaxID=1168544 RepID=A0A9P4GP46_9PLEO|nr:uncharacterized protein K460DRAFT_404393 [Cucurbitaria berberidis CBS 394.84]KAF1849150.1 hypothetical protein K460DRAFT_404393 [Cucurbitaria berberidis CBS 394.84]
MTTLRAPSSLPATKPSPSIPPPQLSWLQGSWNVTHSTLPMWKKSRNVRITYTPIAGTSPLQIDDVVTYQSLSATNIKTIHGVDKPFEVPNTTPASSSGDAEEGTGGGVGDSKVASMAYHWRGKGWLMIASSKWEILGYGDEPATGNSFVVTYFAKTLFTPAGVDFYSRKGSLTPETVESIKAGLTGLGGDVAKLAGELFEVKMDGERTE